MKKLLACFVMILLARFAGGCGMFHNTTYDGSEKAYGMHPEWTDRQPDYMPGDDNGNPPDN